MTGNIMFMLRCHLIIWKQNQEVDIAVGTGIATSLRPINNSLGTWE